MKKGDYVRLTTGPAWKSVKTWDFATRDYVMVDFTVDKGRIGRIWKYQRGSSVAEVAFEYPTGYLDIAVTALEVIPKIDGLIETWQRKFIWAKIKHDAVIMAWNAETDPDKKRRISHYNPNNTTPYPRWDEAHHGLLALRMRQLSEAGFEVSQFWEKGGGKIQFRLPKDQTRTEMILNIIGAVGTNWVGLTFKTTGSIWW